MMAHFDSNEQYHIYLQAIMHRLITSAPSAFSDSLVSKNAMSGWDFPSFDTGLTEILDHPQWLSLFAFHTLIIKQCPTDHKNGSAKTAECFLNAHRQSSKAVQKVLCLHRAGNHMKYQAEVRFMARCCNSRASAFRLPIDTSTGSTFGFMNFCSYRKSLKR